MVQRQPAEHVACSIEEQRCDVHEWKIGPAIQSEEEGEVQGGLVGNKHAALAEEEHCEYASTRHEEEEKVEDQIRCPEYAQTNPANKIN